LVKKAKNTEKKTAAGVGNYEKRYVWIKTYQSCSA